MKHIPADLVERLKPVSLFLMDVDGTLTDGRLYYSAEWVESKAFDVTDGFGIHAIHQYGLKTGIITGRQSLIVSERAKELGIEIVHQGRFEKDKILDKILHTEGLEDRQIAFIGDDLFDLPILLRVGFSAAPADAHPEVRDRVHFVSDFNGGWGAVFQRRLGSGSSGL
jgi:3-deoxy-D-manno-octulosonate 8-phosphate phosphatase (KDO 8-P phosphatase)